MILNHKCDFFRNQKPVFIVLLLFVMDDKIVKSYEKKCKNVWIVLDTQSILENLQVSKRK